MHVYAYYVYMYCILLWLKQEACVQAYGFSCMYVGMYDMLCLLYALLYFPCSPPPGGGGGEGYYC
jgi:hypothetical protein